jgi:hypothetical protein
VGWFDIHPEDDKVRSVALIILSKACMLTVSHRPLVEAESNSSALGATTLSQADIFSSTRSKEADSSSNSTSEAHEVMASTTRSDLSNDVSEVVRWCGGKREFSFNMRSGIGKYIGATCVRNIHNADEEYAFER